MGKSEQKIPAGMRNLDIFPSFREETVTDLITYEDMISLSFDESTFREY